jgi:hypothetical protein
VDGVVMVENLMMKIDEGGKGRKNKDWGIYLL